MVQKAEIILEKFSNGITLNWSDPTGEIDPEKLIVIKGSEPTILGKQIWDDVVDILENTTKEKVQLCIEYKVI